MIRLVFILISLLNATTCIAGPITVEWEYSGAADYYILRRNGIVVAKITGTSPADVETHAEVFDSFTLAAVSGGEETGGSQAYILGVTGTSILKIIKLKQEHHHGRLAGSQPLVLSQ